MNPFTFPISPISPAFLVMSCDRDDRSPAMNAMARDDMDQLATLDRIPFVHVEGSDGGAVERSYLVIPETARDADWAWKMARYFGQRCVLFVDTDRRAYSLDCAHRTIGEAFTHRTLLGSWVAGPSKRPIDGGYTYDPRTGRYWVIRGSAVAPRPIGAPDAFSDATAAIAA